MAIQRGVVSGYNFGTTAMYDCKCLKLPTSQISGLLIIILSWVYSGDEWKIFSKTDSGMQNKTDAANEVRDELYKNAKAEDMLAALEN